MRLQQACPGAWKEGCLCPLQDFLQEQWKRRCRLPLGKLDGVWWLQVSEGSSECCWEAASLGGVGITRLPSPGRTLAP